MVSQARKLFSFEYDDVPTGKIFNTAHMVFKFYYEHDSGEVELMCTYIKKDGEEKGVCVGGYIDETAAKEIIMDNIAEWFGSES